MKIHVVKPGETIYSISKQYNVPASIIIQNNELEMPDNLVVGQTIVIQFPKIVHTVKPGENLYSIARQHNISVINILQNNPSIENSDNIYPGQTIVIAYDDNKIGSMSINGYAYPSIDRKTLRKTLPYLTYLTLFTYGFKPNGDLIGIDDDDLIRIARDYGVAPLMLISTLGEDGQFSNELASSILNDREAQNRLIDNILENLEIKNYFGLDVDFEYIFPQDMEPYVEFIHNLTTKLNRNGYPVIVALAPKTSANQKGLLYEAHNYRAIGMEANAVLLMTYEWGYTYSPPMAVSPINKVREVLDYAVTEINPSKIFMGVPNYGYNWTLPYQEGTRAQSVSNVGAVEIAREFGAEIEYDEQSQAPFFMYYDSRTQKKHIVWFEDARSIDAKLRLVPEYGFAGVSYWNIMRYFPQNWLVASSLFNIDKLL